MGHFKGTDTTARTPETERWMIMLSLLWGKETWTVIWASSQEPKADLIVTHVPTHTASTLPGH